MGIIGSIRKHSWIAVTIVGIAIIAFIIGDLAKRSGGKDTDMAEVNGETLKRSQFENMFEQEQAFNRMLKAYASDDPSLTSEEERALRDSIWANYLDDMVVGEQLEKLGLEVSDAELNDMLTGTFIHPMFANDPNLRDTNGQYIPARMSSQIKALEAEGVDPFYRTRWEKTKELVKKDRLRQKYVTLITSGFYMPKPIANQMASYSGRGVNVSVVRMPYDQVAVNELTDADYKKFYDKHKEEYRNFNEEKRVLEYVAFDILPREDDFKAAHDSAMVIWNKLQEAPDTLSRALDIMVRKYSKDVTRYSYDSIYNRYLPSSYFAASFRESLENSVDGKIPPMLVDNKWYFMGRVMGIEERPDSIRTSVLFMFSNGQRDSIRTASLADSLLTELNAGRLDFDTAIAKYSDFPMFRMTAEGDFGDMDWQKEGYIDNIYNSVVESIFKSQGYRVRDLKWFKGLNEQIVKTPKGEHLSFAMPENAGYVIVKVTDLTKTVKKYNLALIVQKVKPSTETINQIQNEANAFLMECHNGKDFDLAVQKNNKQPKTIQVYRTDNRKDLGYQEGLDGVNMVNYLNNLSDVVKWAFNENTKVGDVNMDTKLDRGLEPATGIRSKNGNKDNSVDMIAVVKLKEVYQRGYLSLAQLKSEPMFMQRVSLEKKKEIQMANAQKIAKGCTTINEVAEKLGDTVAIVENASLSFAPNNFGFFDLELKSFGDFYIEGKVQAMAAVAKSNGLIGPIEGSSGIYFIQVNNSVEMPQADPEQIRLSREIMARWMYGSFEALSMHSNETLYADWNVVRYMPRLMIFTGNERQPYYPLYRDCKLTQWLRANAKVEDHREQIY